MNLFAFLFGFVFSLSFILIIIKEEDKHEEEEEDKHEEDKHEERTFGNILNAVFPFEADNSWELSVLEGDQVEIFQHHESGWSWGRKVKSGSAAPAVEGWLPTSVVEGCALAL